MGRRGYGVLRAVARAHSAQVRRQAAEARRLASEQRHMAAEQRRQAAAYRRQQALNDRQAHQEYLQSMEAEADLENRELNQRVSQLESILLDGLKVSWPVDFESMKRPLMLPPFDAQGADQPAPEPSWEQWMPKPLGLASKLVPGSHERFERQMGLRRTQFEFAHTQWREYEAARVAWLQEAWARHQQAMKRLQEEITDQHRQVEEFREGYTGRDPVLVNDYFNIVLAHDTLPEGFPQSARVAYVPESRQLVVERDLPDSDVVPSEKSYRYVRARDVIEASTRPTTQMKSLYASVIAQFALRTLHALFAADSAHAVDIVVLNCVLETINPATGKSERPCLLTVRTSRDVFAEHDLSRVDPSACLRHLSAEVSANPYEIHPVRPIVDFNMVDPRFVDKQDVLSSLESRPNLAELTPPEFEALITNLFEKMGLETRLTQASRDGGVDCVAWDMRPVVGGKVIVQAKRYKNTVGISAVRDLFGTVHNEGAAKGILVSTSGYGKASYEFASNKPLELITGGQLLYLLEQHSGIKARIEFPEDWEDPAGLSEHSPPAAPPAAPEPEAITTPT